MSTEAMKRIKSLLQDCAKIDSHTISAVVAECDMAILAQHPATGEPVKVAPYNPTEEMRWAMKRIDPALSSEQCRALWSAAWSATPSTHPAPSVPDEKPLPDLMMASYHEAIGWNACRAAMLAAAPAAHPAPSVRADVVRDAERYRWLRDNWFTMGASYPEDTVKFHLGNARWSEQPESNLDAAIDDAMLAAKEPS